MMNNNSLKAKNKIKIELNSILNQFMESINFVLLTNIFYQFKIFLEIKIYRNVRGNDGSFSKYLSTTFF